MADDTIIDLATRRPQTTVPVALMHLEPLKWPAGPFTVTISDTEGKMFEVVFPDHSGELPPDAAILGTGGVPNIERLVVNLLAGALRVFAGGV